MTGDNECGILTSGVTVSEGTYILGYIEKEAWNPSIRLQTSDGEFTIIEPFTAETVHASEENRP
jgi:hypothetical protein